MSHHLSSSILFPFIIFLNLCFHTYSITHWEDIQSLKHFHHDVVSTSITPGSCLSTWDFTSDPCDSLSTNIFTCGIRCDVVFSNITRVTELTLDQAGYSGSLTPSLNLPYLQTLDLSNNFFTGPIPGSFSNLTRLQQLVLSSNSFTGSIPDSLPINLIELTMRNNSLQGNIPASLVNSSVYLQVLDLSYNNLTGSVKPELFTHPSLQQLTLSYNNLQWIETPTNNDSELIAIDLSNNNIHGLLPGFMGWMAKLTALSLENNKFTGMIPTQYAVKAMGEDGSGRVGPFERLLLGGNYLVGLIPGVLLRVKDGSGVMIRLGDNCLYECPESFGFCDGVQKSLIECRSFSQVNP